VGSDLRYNLINSFRSIDTWRANIVFNMFGSVTPGFKKRDIFLGVKSGEVGLQAAEAQGGNRGSRAGAYGANSELTVNGYKLAPTQNQPTREQGAGASNTHLSIMGDGFFAVAESLSPNARIFFTRDGSFQWRQRGTVKVGNNNVPVYNLVNNQGLFVLRSQDIAFDPTTGQMRLKVDSDVLNNPPGLVMRKGLERDGFFSDAAKTVPGRIKGLLGESRGGDLSSVDDSQLPQLAGQFSDNNSDLAIVKIPAAADLVASSYGGEIYEAPLDARRGIVPDSLRNWYFREGASSPHVLPQSLEFLDQRGTLDQLNIENETANFVYRNLSTFLQDYNKGIDDLLGIVR